VRGKSRELNRLRKGELSGVVLADHTGPPWTAAGPSTVLLLLLARLLVVVVLSREELLDRGVPVYNLAVGVVNVDLVGDDDDLELLLLLLPRNMFGRFPLTARKRWVREVNFLANLLANLLAL
jgi:hypothetical protein